MGMLTTSHTYRNAWCCTVLTFTNWEKIMARTGLTKAELRWAIYFLRRVVARGEEEEQVLFDLIRKTERMIEQPTTTKRK